MTTPGQRGRSGRCSSPRATPCCRFPNGDGARGGAAAARADGRDRPVRDRDQPPRRLHPARDDIPRARGLPVRLPDLHTKPFVQWTEPVLEPRGEARQEWQIIDEISRAGSGPRRRARGRCARSARLGIRLSPARLIDLALRLGPQGDLFGLRRGGLSIAKLRERPHGMVLGRPPSRRRAEQEGLPQRQARAPRSPPRS